MFPKSIDDEISGRSLSSVVSTPLATSMSSSSNKMNERVTTPLDEALNMIPVGKFHYSLVLMTGLAFMADAMEVSLLSFIAMCAGAEWDLTNEEIATVTSSVFIGELFGGVLFGPLADNYGRRIAFLIACILIAIAGIASGASPNFGTLIALRTIVGIVIFRYFGDINSCKIS
jgi:hypothetical protein